jgi:hypothetical protein
MNRTILVMLFFVTCELQIFSQTYNYPNVALKSHETLEISKVEIGPAATTVFLSVENKRSEGGSFCADKNIFIVFSDGSRTKLTRANNIPVCPKAYYFKSVGEKLQFTLEFPTLKPGIKWFDLIEDCSSNCFWVYGVTLDNELNKKLDEAFDLASKGLPADNVNLFKNIIDSIDNQHPGIEGLLYINIINASIENADKAGAAVWYKRMASSHAPRLNQYLKYLNDKGIKY